VECVHGAPDSQRAMLFARGARGTLAGEKTVELPFKLALSVAMLIVAGLFSIRYFDAADDAAAKFLRTSELSHARYGEVRHAVLVRARYVDASSTHPAYRTYRFWVRGTKGSDSVIATAKCRCSLLTRGVS
jgi:hypothetical protein